MTKARASVKNYSWLKTRSRPLFLAAHAQYNNYLSFHLRHIRRRFHAYCVGNAKTGTHSIARMLDEHYRACHEPEPQFLIDRILATTIGKIDEKALIHYVKKRDERLNLELDSSQLNGFLIHILVTEFKRAKFILTIRDCYSWLNSVMNQQLNNRAPYQWRKYSEYGFGADRFEHSKEEKILLDRGLFTLDGYLSQWATHNKRIFSTVPKDRLLVLKTHEITQRMDEIAAFLDIPKETIAAKNSHSHKAKKDFSLLTKIDRDFLEGKVETYCRELMGKYFPRIESLDDLRF
jgi:hypothetical protein